MEQAVVHGVSELIFNANFRLANGDTIDMFGETGTRLMLYKDQALRMPVIRDEFDALLGSLSTNPAIGSELNALREFFCGQGCWGNEADERAFRHELEILVQGFPRIYGSGDPFDNILKMGDVGEQLLYLRVYDLGRLRQEVPQKVFELLEAITKIRPKEINDYLNHGSDRLLWPHKLLVRSL